MNHGCTLCPRNCGVDRSAGQTGFCRETGEIRIARAALHYWEEPCISASEGSGAVFFEGCSLGCIYCQNYRISRGQKQQLGQPERDRPYPVRAGEKRQPGQPEGDRPYPVRAGENRWPGQPERDRPYPVRAGEKRQPEPLNGSVSVTPEELSRIFLRLQEQHANNINLVTAGHFVPQVRTALLLAKQKGLSIPVVYNSSGYEKVQTLRMLEGLVDIYLPDLKYLDEELAARYSHAKDYPQTARAAIDEMVRQCPVPEFDSRGRMLGGVIVRHLLLPGHVREAKAVTAYLYGTYGNQIYISLMNQYTPGPAVRDDPLLSRRVTKREYRRLLDYAAELGVEQGFYQEGNTAAESFIPDFDGTGVTESEDGGPPVSSM